MKSFYAVERLAYTHWEYPTFLGCEDDRVIVGQSNRHSTLTADGGDIVIRSKRHEVTKRFKNWVSEDGKSTIRNVPAENNLKYLCWFVWFNLEGCDDLLMAIRSLIMVGGYTGDIVVLSDRGKPAELQKFSQVRFLNVVDDVKARMKRTTLTKNNVYFTKSLISHYVDLAAYDWMIYSDADTVCTQPHVMALLGSMIDRSFIYYHKDSGRVLDRSPQAGLGVLTGAETHEHAGLSVNAGWLLLPCNDLGYDVLSKQRAMAAASNYDADDQGCLYGLMIREKWPRKLALGIKGGYDGYADSPMHSESQIVHCYSLQRFLQKKLFDRLGV